MVTWWLLNVFASVFAYNDLVTATTTITTLTMMTTTTTQCGCRDTWVYYHLDGKLIQMGNAIRMSDALCTTVQSDSITCRKIITLYAFWPVRLFGPIVNLSGNKTVINVIPVLMDFKSDIVWGNPFQERGKKHTRRLNILSRIWKSK